MNPYRYVSVYNPKNTGRKQKFGYAKKFDLLYKSAVGYVNVDFKKLVSALFHAGSALVESESIKRKSRLSE